MTYLSEFKAEARKDIIDAAGWYRDRQEGLDNKFLSAIEETVNKILANPHAGTNFYKTFRETSIKNFLTLLFTKFFLILLSSTRSRAKIRKRKSGD